MCPQRPLLSLVVLLAHLILVTTSLLGCISSNGTPEPAKPDPAMSEPEGGGPAKHDSPQAAYDAVKAATRTKDYNTLCDCLTPESRDVVAGAMIGGASMMMDMAVRERDLFSPENKPHWEASCRALKVVLAKHGVKEDQLKSIQAMASMDSGPSPEDAMAALAKLTTPIKDKPAFMREIKNAMGAMLLACSGKPGEVVKNRTIIIFEGRLENIKVECDRATAQVMGTPDVEEMGVPIIGFKKVNGSWLIEILVPVP